MELNNSTIIIHFTVSLPNLFTYLLVGLVAGVLASLALERARHHYGSFIFVGILGAYLGGFLSRIFLNTTITGLDIPSIIIAFIGSMLILFIHRALTGDKRRI